MDHWKLGTSTLIAHDEAQRLRDDGYLARDTHVHTSASHDVPKHWRLSSREVRTEAARQGLDSIVVTDHDTIGGYDGTEEVFGAEMTVRDMLHVGHTIHTNIYGFTPDQFPEIDRLAREGNIHRLLDYVEDNDLRAQYNHPFWFEHEDKGIVGPRNYAKIKELLQRYQVVEYNTKLAPILNEHAMTLAKEHGKGVMVNTDTHSAQLGTGYTLARGAGFKEWFDAVARGEAYVVVPPTKSTLDREMQAWLGYALDIRDAETEAPALGIAAADAIIAYLGQRGMTVTDRVVRRAARAVARVVVRSGVIARQYLEGDRQIAHRISSSMFGTPEATSLIPSDS